MGGLSYILKWVLESGEWWEIEKLINEYGKDLIHLPIGYKKWSILHVLADNICKEESAKSIYKLIMRYGNELDINIRDRQGETPLHCACRRGNYPQLCELMKLGANIDIICYSSKTPSMILCIHSYEINRKYREETKKQMIETLNNPPRTYKQELIDKRNLLGMILNKCVSIGTKEDINQMLIEIGY